LSQEAPTKPDAKKETAEDQFLSKAVTNKSSSNARTGTAEVETGLRRMMEAIEPTARTSHGRLTVDRTTRQ